MARRNGVHPGNNGSRKGLVQPVLPALPLLSRVKKEVPKAKEQDPLPDAETALQQHTTTKNKEDREQEDIVNEVDQAFDTQQSAAPESEPVSTAGPVDTATQAFDASNQDVTSTVESPRQPNEPHIMPESLASESVHAQVDVASLEAAQSPSRDELAIPGTGMTDLEVAILEEKSLDTQSTSSKETPAVCTLVSAGTAPEAVTDDVETFLSVHHSNQPSISNSSIQQTPKHGITVPVSPVSAGTAQQQNLVNGINEISSNPLVNGRVLSTDLMGPANGLALSPGGPANFPTILDHIRNIQFITQWSDCDICVYFPHATKPAIYRNAHSLILIRSQRLRSFIYPQRAGSYSYYVVNLAPARSIDANAFDAALRFLYVDTILSAENLFPSNVTMDKAGRAAAMDYVVSYMISGMELGLEPVTTRALDLVGRLLDWDLAELAVKEATLLRTSAAATANPHAPPDALLVAKSILQHVFNLIILRLNVKLFTIDTTAAASELASRLAFFEGHRTTINPALANMVFGSMPASSKLSPTLMDAVPEQHTNSPNTIASVIMLNVEFDDLFMLASGLKKVHGEEGVRVIYEVVEERERRRLNILNNRSISNKQRIANAGKWDVIGWHEFVLDGDLHRERVDFLLPTKRGGGNNKNNNNNNNNDGPD